MISSLKNTMKESTIESTVCKYAIDNDFIVLKCLGTKGIPDRIFMRKGECFFIEFKKKGKKLTYAQRSMKRTLECKACPVYVIDNVDIGKDLIDKKVNAQD